MNRRDGLYESLSEHNSRRKWLPGVCPAPEPHRSSHALRKVSVALAWTRHRLVRQ